MPLLSDPTGSRAATTIRKVPDSCSSRRRASVRLGRRPPTGGYRAEEASDHLGGTGMAGKKGLWPDRARRRDRSVRPRWHGEAPAWHHRDGAAQAEEVAAAPGPSASKSPDSGRVRSPARLGDWDDGDTDGRLGRELEQLIRRVKPYLRTGVLAGDRETHRVAEWSAEELRPGGRRTYDRDTPFTVVVPEGREPFVGVAL